jgi:hypothetical protein
MRWHPAEGFVVALACLAAVAGCERAERPASGFADVEEAAPRAAAIIKRDSSLTVEGYRVAEMHVLLPLGTSEAEARVTLQRIIDSVAAADTMAAAVRITGFVMTSIDVEQGTADVLPAMRATWGPVDSAGFTGAARASQYRTEFLIMRPFDSTAIGGRNP